MTNLSKTVVVMFFLFAVVVAAILSSVILLTPIDKEAVCGPIRVNLERYYTEHCVSVCKYNFETWVAIDSGLLG